ncbi:MAG: YybH family protein [Gemmatimonadota bacterium]
MTILSKCPVSRAAVAAGFLLFFNLAASAQVTDSAAVAQVVSRFHEALVAGDSATALSLLAADVTVLEAGGVETREEYRAHHLPGDIAFARAVHSERGPLHVYTRGDVAWTVATSATHGTYRERPIDSTGAELMVLTRTPAGWRVSAIHWSSRQRRR